MVFAQILYAHILKDKQRLYTHRGQTKHDDRRAGQSASFVKMNE